MAFSRIKKFISRGITYIVNGIPNSIVNAQIVYSLPSEKLKNKKIIVTGGGSGIGYAMAKKFKEEGAQVLIAGRNEDKLRKSSKEKLSTTTFVILELQLWKRAWNVLVMRWKRSKEGNNDSIRKIGNRNYVWEE